MDQSNPRIVRVDHLNTDTSPAGVLLVVPTYNERENIGPLLQALAKIEPAVDILVADDGSPDGTADAVTTLAPTIPRRIYLMRRQGKYGLGVCYLDAFNWTLEHLPTYDCIVQMDADFSHPPESLPALIQNARESGMAIGSRYVPGGSTPDWNARRVFLSKSGNLYARSVLRLFFPSYPVRDNTAGFMAWRRDVLQHVLSKGASGDGYAFLTVLKFMSFRLGINIKEVPIIFRDRRLGVSKLNRNIIFEAIFMPWRLGWKFRKPLL